EDATHLEPAHHRQVEVEDHEVWRAIGDGLQRGVTRVHGLRFDFSAAFERVLDESGYVLLVFDDEDARFWHDTNDATFARFPPGDARVNSGLRNAGSADSCGLFGSGRSVLGPNVSSAAGAAVMCRRRSTSARNSRNWFEE